MLLIGENKNYRCVVRGGLHENPALIRWRTCTYSLAPGVFFLPVISFQKSQGYYSWLCLYWGKNAGGMSLVMGMARRRNQAVGTLHS